MAQQSLHRVSWGQDGRWGRARSALSGLGLSRTKAEGLLFLQEFSVGFPIFAKCPRSLLQILYHTFVPLPEKKRGPFLTCEKNGESSRYRNRDLDNITQHVNKFLCQNYLPSERQAGALP